MSPHVPLPRTSDTYLVFRLRINVTSFTNDITLTTMSFHVCVQCPEMFFVSVLHQWRRCFRHASPLTTWRKVFGQIKHMFRGLVSQPTHHFLYHTFICDSVFCIILVKNVPLSPHQKLSTVACTVWPCWNRILFSITISDPTFCTVAPQVLACG